jgi:hypothetical protein
MDESSMIKVLLIGDSRQLFFRCQKYLERNGCECEFAECEKSVWKILDQRQIDLVLSLHTSQGTHSPSLVELLSGLPTTLFYGLRVEVGYWWVPILRLGEECFGVPALRPCEFSSALNEVLKEIRAEANRNRNPSEKCNRSLIMPESSHPSNQVAGIHLP